MVRGFLFDFYKIILYNMDSFSRCRLSATAFDNEGMYDHQREGKKDRSK